MKPIPLYFIAGFLGTGKTTVLNNLLGSLDGRRAGLIVNEFGAVGIDASRISASDDIFELNNGQIFCACLAAPLASSLTRLSERGPDLILAECSGLSKPATLKDIAEGAAKTTEGQIQFAGLITIVDAPRYPVLAKSVQAVREQVYYAGMVIINKTDLVTPEEAERTEALLRELRSDVPIIKAEYGKVSFDRVERTFSQSLEIPELEERYMGWGSTGRPKSYFFFSKDPVDHSRLTTFLSEASKSAYRIKGNLVSVDGGHILVDCVEETVVTEKKRGEPAVKGIVVIVPGDGPQAGYFSDLWNQTLKTGVQVS